MTLWFFECLSPNSTEIRGLCSMILSSETLQNLPYCWNKKNPNSFFLFFISSNFGILTVDDALVYVRQNRPANSLLKIQSCPKWKIKKQFAFPYSKNMTISSSINLLFLKSGVSFDWSDKNYTQALLFFASSPKRSCNIYIEIYYMNWPSDETCPMARV